MAKPKILFLCTGNSCCSQMAEGWAHALKSDAIEAHSAGTTPQGLNPWAARVMAEAGVDISGHSSKHIDELDDIPFDYVATVCAAASQQCPTFRGEARVVHVGFDDPRNLRRPRPRTRRDSSTIAECAMRSGISSPPYPTAWPTGRPTTPRGARKWQC